MTTSKTATLLLACALQVLAATSVLANDSMATLGAGGLIFTRSEEITMAKEDLYISPEKVEVKYLYRNTTDKPVKTIVAFPMPKIGGPVEVMSAVPDEQSDNFMDFSVVQDGEEIEPNLQQRVLVRGIDFTAEVEEQEIPLQPLLKETTEALKTLEPEVIKDWLAKGLIVDLNYFSTDTSPPEYVPVWELESTFWWETTFPAGAEVEVEHRYKPSVGGSAGLVFAFDGKPSDAYADYQKRYCVDETFLNATAKLEKKQNPDAGIYYFEQWLSYILTTGNNWYGPIGDFHLTVDKLNPESIVSFCGEGVKKTGPTTFEMRAKDYYPSNDLHILLVVTNKVATQAP
ncbi:hypothetical protein J2045_004007 [Peteryoungia aggregata LMG 23059]|uniref:DUF4424 domain-containing protein n=1 Tax=Peteryoungia aggregata LMG 23059 TaxID=1368425 RepID=A0ABU0GC77_9HYPH|nr:DUF4424 domain-containing protein [Peteryoungia aggregata]MDQ0422957.1 hypothetical protein [Peteryoungia aggregata LMG 23059]